MFETLVQYKEMREAIQRVRKLHKPKTWKDGSVFCLANCEQEYPCPTIQALDGDN